MKKILIVIAILLMASCAISADEKAGQEQSASNAAGATVVDNGQYSLGISNGLLFRFVSKNWCGYEIPLTVSYASSDSGNILSAGVTTGYGLVLPVKIIGGLHVNFIPEITAGYSRAYSMTSNLEYNSDAKEDETVDLNNSSYTITAGAAFKLEVEYFIGSLVSFLPGDISIGGSLALNLTGNYTESSTETYDGHVNVNTIVSAHTCYFGYNAAFGLTGTALSNLVVRYYF
jgi:hypothetical protein